MKSTSGQTYTVPSRGVEPSDYGPVSKRYSADPLFHSTALRSTDKLSLLSTVSIFNRLTSTELAILASSLGAQSFDRGQAIFHQGDYGDTLYVIARGQVRIYHPSAAGRELSVAIYCTCAFFGELALLDGQPRSASAEAMLPTITLTLARRTFLQTIRKHPVIAEALLAELAVRLRATTGYAKQLANPSAPQRIGWLVLDLAQRYGTPNASGICIDLQLTQDDLASMFGVTRETVNRVLARLREQGLVTFAEGQLLVPDCARLERALEQLCG
jgi:CRP/FNR family transcriptional regulator, cyclic AMP receptor protein